MQANKLERSSRIKYLRALEGALIKITKAVKRNDFNPERFEATKSQIIKTFASIERITLDSTYSKSLEKFINTCCLENLEQNEILNQLNMLDKLRKTKRYKKEKHKHKIFEE